MSAALDPRAARLVLEAAGDHGARVERDALLSRHTSAGVGGAVPFLLTPPEAGSAGALLASLRETGAPVLVLGNGTNLIVADEGGPWVVVRLGGQGCEARIEGEIVTAPGGMSLPYLVRRTIRAGLRGLEHAEGIPGTVGGAVAGNAGCYGGDMARVVRRLRVLRGGKTVDMSVGPEHFGYRRSPVAPEDVVLEVEMRLVPDEVEVLRSEAAEYRARRMSSQPVGRRSAGCVFKNTEGDSAGRLVDAAGLKGRRVGGASVSAVHANFLVNEGGARAADFLALIETLQEEVEKRFRVRLEPEVRIWSASKSAGRVAAGSPS